MDYVKVDNAPRPKKGTVKGYILTQKLIRRINELEIEDGVKEFLICKYLNVSTKCVEKALKSKDLKSELTNVNYRNGRRIKN
jgi:hypothetical protein